MTKNLIFVTILVCAKITARKPYLSYSSFMPPANMITLILAISLLVLLIRRPEWYVINTVGILVGAGTITMLGVSFVPWIIILFMVLAAVYDAWAVYKSKHMLEMTL